MLELLWKYIKSEPKSNNLESEKNEDKISLEQNDLHSFTESERQIGEMLAAKPFVMDAIRSITEAYMEAIENSIPKSQKNRFFVECNMNVEQKCILFFANTYYNRLVGEEYHKEIFLKGKLEKIVFSNYSIAMIEDIHKRKAMAWVISSQVKKELVERFSCIESCMTENTSASVSMRLAIRIDNLIEI